MKHNFKSYIIIWTVCVVIFHVIVFITPNEIAGTSKFTGSFWVGYIFIMLTFLGQLGVVRYTMQDDPAKLFYRIPLFAISYITLVIMLLVGALCMIIPRFPVWLGIIFCMLVLAFCIISMVQAQSAISIVEDLDTKIKNKIFFMKSLTVEVDSLIMRTDRPEIRDEIKKLSEIVRYSDPMSNESLSEIETQITLKVRELSEDIEKYDIDGVKKISKEIKILLNDRNEKCKLLK